MAARVGESEAVDGYVRGRQGNTAFPRRDGKRRRFGNAARGREIDVDRAFTDRLNGNRPSACRADVFGAVARGKAAEAGDVGNARAGTRESLEVAFRLELFIRLEDDIPRDGERFRDVSRGRYFIARGKFPFQNARAETVAELADERKRTVSIKRDVVRKWLLCKSTKWLFWGTG